MPCAQCLEGIQVVCALTADELLLLRDVQQEFW
jgi:hypothetical protein